VGGARPGLFAREGLVPTLTITADSKQVFSGMMDGRYHVAITAFDNIVAYQEGQANCRSIRPAISSRSWARTNGFLSLVAVPEVATFEQVARKTISVDAMTNGFSFALREMLRRNGLSETDVQWAQAGGTDRRFAALMESAMRPRCCARRSISRRRIAVSSAGDGSRSDRAVSGIVGAARRSWAASNQGALVNSSRVSRCRALAEGAGQSRRGAGVV